MHMHRGRPQRRAQQEGSHPQTKEGGLGRNQTCQCLDLSHKIFILSQPRRERINREMRDERKEPVSKVGDVRGEWDLKRSMETQAVIRIPPHLRAGRLPCQCGLCHSSAEGPKASRLYPYLDHAMHYSASPGDEAARSSLGCSTLCPGFRHRARIPAGRASAPSSREVLREEGNTPVSNQSNQGRRRRERKALGCFHVTVTKAFQQCLIFLKLL